MKRTFFLVLLVFLLIFSVHSQTAEQSSGVILELTGVVELKPAGASSFYYAWEGSEVAQGTVISTGFKSTAVIAVGSSIITVQPLTRLSLSEIQNSAGAENLNVNLEAGRIRVDVKPAAGVRANTAVQSPSATASVRGTSLEMDALNVNVIEGNVIFSGKDGLSQAVSGGSSSAISANGSALNPADIAVESLMPPRIPGSGASGQVYNNTKITSQPDNGIGLILIW